MYDKPLSKITNTIGLLYESGEWSDYKLAAELAELGCSVRLIDMAHMSKNEIIDAVSVCSLLVSRVFASAVFRHHNQAHVAMDAVCHLAATHNIPMINEIRAHYFEIDKQKTTNALAQSEIEVPTIQACGFPSTLLECARDGSLTYPCIIKPNCGGRTTYTVVTRSRLDAEAFLELAPNILFLVEDYIEPEKGYITRIEIVDGASLFVVKRSVTSDGLSAYHLGSTYEMYPECSQKVVSAAEQAGRALGITFGSFDIIEQGLHSYIIDANAVSNVSPDNTDMFGIDLMKTYAQAIAAKQN